MFSKLSQKEMIEEMGPLLEKSGKGVMTPMSLQSWKIAASIPRLASKMKINTIRSRVLFKLFQSSEFSESVFELISPILLDIGLFQLLTLYIFHHCLIPPALI